MPRASLESELQGRPIVAIAIAPVIAVEVLGLAVLRVVGPAVAVAVAVATGHLPLKAVFLSPGAALLTPYLASADPAITVQVSILDRLHVNRLRWHRHRGRW